MATKKVTKEEIIVKEATPETTVEETAEETTEIVEFEKKPNILVRAAKRVKNPKTKAGTIARNIAVGSAVFVAGCVTGKILNEKGEASDQDVLDFFKDSDVEIVDDIKITEI